MAATGGAAVSAAVPDPAAALAPVRDALHCAALRDAARDLLAAADRTRSMRDEAHRRATEILDRAREAGVADARAAMEVERARTRRRGRAAVLSARMDAYRTLRGRTRAAVRALPAGADYPALRAALVTTARRRLGPDVEIVEADGGGVRARAGDRRLDLSLDTLADRATDAVAAGLERP